MPKNVGKYVGEKAKKPKPKVYKKGPFPFTVIHIPTGDLFVRKSITLKKLVLSSKGKPVKQRQVWRACEPPTSARAGELVREIDAEVIFRRTGRVRPLSKFEDIAAQFELVELVEASYENGKKIAGRRSLVGPRATVKMLKEYFGASEIREISFGELEAFKALRIKTPVVTKNTSRPRSIRTVHYELGFLRQILNFAYRRRWLDRNPFDDGKNLINVSDETRRHQTWTRAEEAGALALCTGALLAHMRVVIICITDGGFRAGELLGCKWSEVDFENGVIPAKSYKGKNLSIRSVFMTNRMRQALMDWKKAQKKIDKISDASLVVGYKSVKNAWNTIRTKIHRPDLHIHDLRHIFATRLHLEAKTQISVISKALGHSSTRTTEIYINAQTDDVRREMAKLNELNEAAERVLSREKTKV